MKRFILFGILLFLASTSFSQTTFQKIYGGIHDDETCSSQQTSDGGFMIAGSTHSYGDGGYDFYLIKTDAIGDTLWTRTYGTTDDEQMYAAQQTADGGYIMCGRVNKNYWNYIYVVKTNSSGVVLWSNLYTNMRITLVSSMQQTQDAGFIIAGQCDSIAGPSPIIYSFLMKLDGAGNLSWAKSYNLDGVFTAERVKEISGGFIVTGHYDRTMVMRTDASGNMIWVKSFSSGFYDYGIDAVQSGNGDFIILTEVMDTNWVSSINVFRLNNAGGLLWSKNYSGSNLTIYPTSILADGNGNFYLTGGFYDYTISKGFLSKIDATGNLLWTSVDGVAGFTSFIDVSFTNDTQLVLGGVVSYPSIAVDSGSLYLCKKDLNGISGCNQSTAVFTVTSPTLITGVPTCIVYSGASSTAATTNVHSGSIVIDACTVGIIENQFQEKVSSINYPNPFIEKTTIEIVSTLSNEKREFELYDINGKIVRQFYFTGNLIEIDRETILNGIYFYKISSADRVIASGKIIAQ